MLQIDIEKIGMEDCGRFLLLLKKARSDLTADLDLQVVDLVLERVDLRSIFGTT